jgi:biopolymer transport protein ExbD
MSLLNRRARKRPELPLVPLIDVLVMLVLFAYVTMQARVGSTLNITLPKVDTAGKMTSKARSPSPLIKTAGFPLTEKM